MNIVLFLFLPHGGAIAAFNWKTLDCLNPVYLGSNQRLIADEASVYLGLLFLNII